ncbi:MAG: Nudix hydrolase domain-containing protein [Lachnoclostridium sp.]|jgi:nucleoside triphosphatase
MEKYRIMVKGIVQYQDKYLIVKKWYDDRILDPYQWEFIDGKLEFGEEPEKGVLRLIYETTGLTAYVNRILYTWSFMMGDVWNIGISFLCLSTSDEVMLCEELNDFKWVTREEFGNYISNKAVLADIEKAEL